ncbi:MAG: tetratricopeptide repeat protein, partial [Proteobacteria bacterium]|nr:tetratricopeptide repeat protein [Pseudomonadota bacterium]
MAEHPDNFDANNILGDLLAEFGDPDGALDHFERAWAKQPDNPTISHNRAYPLLVRGDFEAGYAALEYRWHGRPRRPFHQPAWDGSALAGKSLLVWSEQGVGDTVLFASCLGEAAAAAGRC